MGRIDEGGAVKRRSGYSETKPNRLSRGERIALAGLCVLALATMAVAMLKGLAGSFEPSVRDTGVANQSGWIFFLALTTPFSAWAVLRGGRKRWVGIVAWSGLLISCSWWWWPGPPEDVFDREQPLWYGSQARIPWLLVAAGLAIGLYAALKSRQRFAVIGAALFTVIAVAGAAASYVNLAKHADAERSVPLPGGARELTALKADPLWTSLPDAEVIGSREGGVSRAAWGERIPTYVGRTLDTAQDNDLFVDIVAVAESNGWKLISSMCLENDYWWATLRKTLSVGPAHLDIRTSLWEEVIVDGNVSKPPPLPPLPGTSLRCWEK